MKKHFLLFTLTILLLSFNTPSYAETIKTIKLTDGSVLKGNVLKLENNLYTLEILTLGRIEIPESDIISITSTEATSPERASSDGSQDDQKAKLKNQVQQIQGNIMTDPGLITDIQDAVSDQKVQAILSNPQLIKDVLSYDQERIQQNENIQELISNPKIQNLMDEIYKKIPPQK